MIILASCGCSLCLIKVKTFIRRAQSEFEITIKKVRSDNGSEFRNTNVEKFLDEEGIKHEFSAPYTPQQNGVVERKNRTLIEMAKIILDEYKTQDIFWAEAINTACHTINRLYLHKFHKTSYQLITGSSCVVTTTASTFTSFTRPPINFITGCSCVVKIIPPISLLRPPEKPWEGLMERARRGGTGRRKEIGGGGNPRVVWICVHFFCVNE
jgi:hypothetical protein